MGLLVDGQWVDQWYETDKTEGRFIRTQAQFRHWITQDGSAGRTGDSGFKAESGRYHLYVSLACPWAHRTLILRKLKGLEPHISVSIVHPDMMEDGWTFSQVPVDGSSSEVGDRLFHSEFYHQIYTRSVSDYSGRVTVPVLWDCHQQCIVNNESSEIIEMFNSAFNELTGNTVDFYPQSLRTQIDSVNERVYNQVNNGVYKAGFATTQQAYEDAFDALFETLAWIEECLAQSRYLVGNQITLADWRLFTTLVRFDAVYFGHFKCNLKRIIDYPNIYNYMKDLYQVEGVVQTVDIAHIKRHYYFSHRTINPTGVVPNGPLLDFLSDHDRKRFD